MSKIISAINTQVNTQIINNPVLQGESYKYLRKWHEKTFSYVDLSKIIEPKFEIIDAKMNRCVKKLKDTGKMPSIELIEKKDGYEICDGYHRYSAAKKLGYEKIPAFIFKYLYDEIEGEKLAKCKDDNGSRMRKYGWRLYSATRKSLSDNKSTIIPEMNEGMLLEIVSTKPKNIALKLHFVSMEKKFTLCIDMDKLQILEIKNRKYEIDDRYELSEQKRNDRQFGITAKFEGSNDTKKISGTIGDLAYQLSDYIEYAIITQN